MSALNFISQNTIVASNEVEGEKDINFDEEIDEWMNEVVTYITYR